MSYPLTTLIQKNMINVEIPDKLSFLFEPHRYKVAYGGRGAGKSHSMVRALLVLGANKRLRILCTREVQKSIRDSVHKLLSDQIVKIGLEDFYTTLDTEIRGKNGTEFVFSGLSNQTIDSIKSFEGCDICFCEEAQTISKRSWDILIPTIRNEGSEIWISFNPSLDTDETYVRFVVSPPASAVVVKVNYSDNPWFPDVLEAERIHCQLYNREDYAQIWEGECRPSIAGAIYAAEMAKVLEEERICNVPYDPRFKVHCVFDLGFSDATTVIMVQRVRSEIRVIDYYEERHKTLDQVAAVLNMKQYNWGYDWLPHDGYAMDIKAVAGSAEKILKRFGRKPRSKSNSVPNTTIDNGIRAARSCIRQTVFDKKKCARLVECLKRYRRSINQQTLEPGNPVHDEFSHGADAMRYLGLVADKLTNEEIVPSYDLVEFDPVDKAFGY